MADKIKFGDVAASGQTGAGQTDGVMRSSEVCGHIEAMLMDALDGTLSATDQALFEAHTSHCAACSAMLADARRGAAWLDLLRSPRPEPPVALLERILAQTSGAEISVFNAGEPGELDEMQSVPAAAYGNVFPIPPAYGVPARYGEMQLGGFPAGKVLPFRSRVALVMRPAAQSMMQPRLMMTAAMAFFSIAVTMNLTGVQLRDLSANNLRPENLRREVSAANVRVAQYYEGIRVVHELESRVDDLRISSDAAADRGQRPSRRVESAPAPDTGAAPAEPKPEKRQAPNGGTSRRETPAGRLTTVAVATLTEPTPPERRSL